MFFLFLGLLSKSFVEVLLPISSKTDGGYAFVGFRGLASHGAANGILTGIIIYQRFNTINRLAWILDRLIIPTALGAGFVRIGNFFNSEIVGKYTVKFWGNFCQPRAKYCPVTQRNCTKPLATLFCFSF